MAAAAPRRTGHNNWLTIIGMAMMALAFVWWFLFYAQWTGPLRLLDLKVPCLVHTIEECSYFRSNLGEFHASGPAYQPIIWWVGISAFLAGRFLIRAPKQGGASQ